MSNNLLGGDFSFAAFFGAALGDGLCEKAYGKTTAAAIEINQIRSDRFVIQLVFPSDAIDR
jgi:hypothetical protein